MPGEDMIVDAVDEGAVEIEQKGSLCYGHGLRFLGSG
jgi:hypothetical protein